MAGGFWLANPTVQVVEKKPKLDVAASPVPEPQGPEPPTSPAPGYLPMTRKRRV